MRPTNYRELFNLRHASLRNVIERAFGILKRKWKAIGKGCEYDLETQIKLFPVLGMLHNFSVTEDDEKAWSYNDVDVVSNIEEERFVRRQDSTAAAAFRDKIAQEMWIDYQNYVRDYGYHGILSIA